MLIQPECCKLRHYNVVMMAAGQVNDMPDALMYAINMNWQYSLLLTASADRPSSEGV